MWGWLMHAFEMLKIDKLGRFSTFAPTRNLGVIFDFSFALLNPYRAILGIYLLSVSQ